jgi:formylglycine-generating enzyme required for sulfatase activity
LPGIYYLNACNAWEWCSDGYRADYYQMVNRPEGITNPQGPAESYDPDEPYAHKRVIRGGSFLCNDAYCSGYRNARRMKTTPDSGMEHLGFRCVK